MGYYVTTTDMSVRIPVEKANAALEEMKRINKPEFDHLKRGGSFGGGYKKATLWYSWMPESFEHFESIEEFLKEVGFESTKRDGDFIVLGSYDNKTGSEAVFLTYLAPFITKNSFINWSGEDGAMWQHFFDGKQMITRAAIVSYE